MNLLIQHFPCVQFSIPRSARRRILWKNVLDRSRRASCFPDSFPELFVDLGASLLSKIFFVSPEQITTFSLEPFIAVFLFQALLHRVIDGVFRAKLLQFGEYFR